jgi:hypothetical protein
LCERDGRWKKKMREKKKEKRERINKFGERVGE